MQANILESAVNSVGYTTRRHKDWFDDNAAEIHKLVETKNKAHNAYLANPQSKTLKTQLKNLRTETQRTLRVLENNWWLGIAQEIQKHADSNNTHSFYQAIKTVYGPQRKNLAPVRSADGDTLIKDKQQILERWSEHFSSLLNHRNPTIPNIIEELPNVPQITILDELPSFQEVLAAVKHLKNNKSAGPDGIPAEIYKEGGYMLHLNIHELITCIWQSRTVPQSLKDAIIITIYKNKGDKAICGNSRGISLLAIIGKIITRIMLTRLIQHMTENILPESQCSFRKDRCTTDMIFVARQLLEKSREQNKDIFMAFIDLSKAFDTVNRELLWRLLEKLGIPPTFLAILRDFHDGMTARVQAGGALSDPFEVNMGVKQGCVLAPVLFNIFLLAVYYLTHNALGNEAGIGVQFRLDGSLFNLRRLQAHTKTSLSNTLQYADD